MEQIEEEKMPADFSFIRDIDPSIIQSPRYCTEQNFLGSVMLGYDCKEMVMTTKAALKLKDVQQDLLKQGYSLVLYDTYRPQRTVDTFIAWAKEDGDLKMKELYFPGLTESQNKRWLFENGYIASRSGHTRGSTADLSIIEVGK